MSDLVRYMVGNTASRDVINWPVILRSEIASVIGAISAEDIGRTWPVEMSIAQIMAMNWRVKKWKFSGSASVSISYFDSGISQTTEATATSTIADTDVFPMLDGSPVATEKDLVKREFDSLYKALVFDRIAAETSAVSAWTVDGTDQIGMGAPSPFSESGDAALPFFGIFGGFALFDDPKLSPNFNGLGALIPIVGSGSSTRIGLDASFDKTPDTVGGGTVPTVGAIKAPGTLTINPGIADAFDVPLELSWRLTGQANGATISGSGSGSWTLEALEFWEYATIAAEPVYDGSTGAQLRDPFS